MCGISIKILKLSSDHFCGQTKTETELENVCTQQDSLLPASSLSLLHEKPLNILAVVYLDQAPCNVDGRER